MNTFVDEMRGRIVLDFTPAWELNDGAHRLKHFAAVEACGNAINDRLGLGYHPGLIMMVAMFHDMFSWSRVNHHHMSAEWVMTTDYDIITSLTGEERKMVAAGCREHRASNQERFSCEFAALMNAADREIPGDVDAMIERAVQYRVARGMSREEAMGPAIEHIVDKFGDGGYARYPDMYLEAFGDTLTEQRRQIANL